VLLRAQDGLQNMVFAAGTTRLDGAGRPWAYILWQGSAPDLLRGKKVAVYAKSGDAASLASYQRKAIVTLQTDPDTITALLNRAANLGGNLNELDHALTNLFQNLLSPTTRGAMSVGEKLSVIIRGIGTDPEHYGNLLLLARLHPGVSSCLGLAHAELLSAPGLTTFELREYDFLKAQDIGVIGRVTVASHLPVVLPAPDRPVAVPEVNPKGHLNVKLRWALPTNLLHYAVLNYGFNLYRMTRSYAEANSYVATPPSNTVLITLAGTNANVKRLNTPPVLKNKDFDPRFVPGFAPGFGPGQVADFVSSGADTNSYFFADDNDQFQPGGQPFVKGSQYYYFVTARDVLGRDGAVSMASALVTVCDRLPPFAPKGLKVVNDYTNAVGGPRQLLKLTWLQNTNAPPEATSNYFVYRWSSPSEMQASEGNPALNLIAGPIRHAPGQATLEYLDNGPGAPQMPADASRTFWYSVRADNGACLPMNLSGNSAPAWGVLRQRAGPPAPTVTISNTCTRPEVRYLGAQDQDLPSPPLDPNYYFFRLTCYRSDAGIAWADFYYCDTNSGNFLGRRYFSGDSSSAVSVDYSVLRTAFQGNCIQFLCRVGSTDGKTTTYALAPEVGVSASRVREVLFFAHTATFFDGNCDEHDPLPPGATEPICPPFTLTLKAPAKEWKLYRRIDDGPLTMIKQGVTNTDFDSIIMSKDCALPVYAAKHCYYAQAFDEHGNASALTNFRCLSMKGTLPLPIPMLSRPARVGAEAAPMMSLRWFCAPHGVERFELGIVATLGETAVRVALPANFSSDLSPDLELKPNTHILIEGGKINTFYDVAQRRTPRVGPNFGSNGVFSLNVNIQRGVTYTVFIRAVDAGGKVGEWSNFEQFLWTPPPPPLAGPQVPWPQRGLPGVTNSFTNGIHGIHPVLLSGSVNGVGVRIGSFFHANWNPESADTSRTLNGNTDDPMRFLYTNVTSGDSVFPIVMYRCQVPSTAYPRVSGDIIQVSPLMEQIAYERFGSGGAAGIIIHDPFVALSRPGGSTVPTDPLEIYLLDTQPVVIGAKYKYLLVRFASNHEIAQVIPTAEVEITP